MNTELSFHVPPFELRTHLKPGEIVDCGKEPLYIAFGDLGLGIFAKRHINAGTIIHTFSGPRISFEDVVGKEDRQCWPLQVAPAESAIAYVDLDHDAPGCFVNHSCNPNAAIVDDCKLVAIREIPPNIEIRYDYSTTMLERSFEMECRCNSINCRKVVRDFDTLPLCTQQYYLRKGFVCSYIKPLIGR